MGGQKLLFDPADGQHPTAQGDLAGHGDISADGTVGQGADDGGRHRDARTRTIFGGGPLENVDVEVAGLMEVHREIVDAGAVTEVGDAGLSALLHDIAELAGERHLALASHRHHFDVEGDAPD